MRLLYLTTPDEDYLQDQVLIGLRRLLGDRCVEYPRKEALYKSCERPSSELYGNGFTVWKTLPDCDVDREDVRGRLVDGEFDVVVFGNVQRQKELFWEFERERYFDRADTTFVFLDGQDFIRRHNVLWQYGRRALDSVKRRTRWRGRTDKLLVYPIFEPALSYGPYFKRELTKAVHDSYRTAPLFTTSFSIPREKVRGELPSKEKPFPRHVQCDEAYELPSVAEHSVDEKVFESEQPYYDDIAASKFGVTEKKSGWDCMRHYEIAANATVPCFYRLHDKPTLCAPHGLRDMHNCVAFSDADELAYKLDWIASNDLYDRLQRNALSWARASTCRMRAREVLSTVGQGSGSDADV